MFTGAFNGTGGGRRLPLTLLALLFVVAALRLFSSALPGGLALHLCQLFLLSRIFLRLLTLELQFASMLFFGGALRLLQPCTAVSQLLGCFCVGGKPGGIRLATTARLLPIISVAFWRRIMQERPVGSAFHDGIDVPLVFCHDAQVQIATVLMTASTQALFTRKWGNHKFAEVRGGILKGSSEKIRRHKKKKKENGLGLACSLWSGR